MHQQFRPLPQLYPAVYVYMLSVTLVLLAKAVGWTEMLFGRNTRVAPSNTVTLYQTGAPVPLGKGRFAGQNR